MKANAPAPNAPPAANGAAPDNLERTRELLFGSVQREIEKRFARLEERLTREMGETRDEFRRRLGQFEVHTKGEIESLSAQLVAEREERSRLFKAAGGERAAAHGSLEEKIAQLVESSGRATRDLTNQTRDQHRLIAEEMQQKFDTLSANLHREAAELRDEKTDRVALADMLSELALRLRREVPGLPEHDHSHDQPHGA